MSHDDIDVQDPPTAVGEEFHLPGYHNMYVYVLGMHTLASIIPDILAPSAERPGSRNEAIMQAIYSGWRSRNTTLACIYYYVVLATLVCIL